MSAGEVVGSILLGAGTLLAFLALAPFALALGGAVGFLVASGI